jgi:hypothetical protein
MASPPLLPPTSQVYIVLTTVSGVGSDTVNDANTLSGVGIIEVSPPGEKICIKRSLGREEATRRRKYMITANDRRRVHVLKCQK